DITDAGLGSQTLTVSGSDRSLTLASQDGAIDATTDEFTQPNHGLHTGTGPVGVTPSGRLPAGLSPATAYWVSRVNDDVFKLAATSADATAGTAVDITDAGVGVTTVTLVNFPCGVDVHDNRFHTYVPAGPDDAAVTFANAQECSFRNNEV